MGNAKVFLGRLVRAASVVVLGAALAVPVAHAGKANTGKSGKPAATAAKKAPAKKTVAKAAPARKVVAKKAAPARSSKTAAARKKTAAKAAVAAAAVAPRLSFGQLAGLHQVHDPLALESSVALVMDQDTKEVLLSKNEQVVLPIASNAQLPMDELITITQADVDTVKRSSSRLQVGTTLSRRELLHLALMSSENRAAHALGRTYPGGMDAFVEQMNFKAKLLGMTTTRFVEPTGLSSGNQSSARDLATLVNVAHAEPLLRSFSTWPSAEVEVGKRTLQFNNTNRLVKSDDWEIGLQKTGYISEAGRCLVMQAEVAGRNLIMVFLDSVGKYSRLGDAQRVRQWIEAGADHS